MTIGIIGMGDMGLMYARIFLKNDIEVIGFDQPQKLPELKQAFDSELISFPSDKFEIGRCDFVLFSVETAKISDVVQEYAPFIRENAIVSGQTSVKTPEILAFETYLPKTCQIITIHSLHGPLINPENQTLIVIRHRAGKEAFDEALSLLSVLKSKIEILPDYQAHDKMMADIQVVTHIGFESIGTSFMHRKIFPWENPLHTSGLDNLKMLLTLRIFSYKHHVYSGMAMLNPYSASDVRAYAESENKIFELMISQEKTALESLIYEAGEAVFGDHKSEPMLNDALMREYSLNPSISHKPNSHLSLLSMVLTWKNLGTNPYKNLICQTPPFKLRVGMAEYLFLNKSLLRESIHTALYDLSIRKDDLAFHTAVQEWAHIVESGDLKGYEQHFEKTSRFLEPRLQEGRLKSNLLIERLQQYENG